LLVPPEPVVEDGLLLVVGKGRLVVVEKGVDVLELVEVAPVEAPTRNSCISREWSFGPTVRLAGLE